MLNGVKKNSSNTTSVGKSFVLAGLDVTRTRDLRRDNLNLGFGQLPTTSPKSGIVIGNFGKPSAQLRTRKNSSGTNNGQCCGQCSPLQSHQSQIASMEALDLEHGSTERAPDALERDSTPKPSQKSD